MRASSLLLALRRYWLDDPIPLLGIEVRSGSVGVVRARREKGKVVLGGAAVVDLPVGTVLPSFAESNVKDGEGLARALRVAAERAGAAGGGSAVLLLPDPAVRVATLSDSEVGHAKGRELVEMARFRLRRLVPFEIRDAQVAVRRPREAGLPSIAAVASREVLAEYEAILSGCGFQAGVVEPAGLALTAALPEGGGADTLIVDWDEAYLTIVVTRHGWPLLFRTVGGVASDLHEIVHEVRSTLLYCQEKLTAVTPTNILVRAPRDILSLDVLQEGAGLPVRLVEAPGLPDWPSDATGCGAALAAVLGRAA